MLAYLRAPWWKSVLVGSALSLLFLAIGAWALIVVSAAVAGFLSSRGRSGAVRGIQATENGPAMVEKGLAICTALAPIIGYDAAAKIAKEAFASGRTIRQVTRETHPEITDADLDRILDAEAMTEPGLGGPGA